MTTGILDRTERGSMGLRAAMLLLATTYAGAPAAGDSSEAERHLQRLMMHHALHGGGAFGAFAVARACARASESGAVDEAPVIVEATSGAARDPGGRNVSEEAP